MMCVTEKEITEPFFSSLFFAFNINILHRHRKILVENTNKLSNHRDHIETTLCGISTETHHFVRRLWRKTPRSLCR